MTTQPPPESARCPHCGAPEDEPCDPTCESRDPSVPEPSPVATDTQALKCADCGGDGYYKGPRLGDEPCPTCKGEGNLVATPAPAGDAEVSHEQARLCIGNMRDEEAWEEARLYISQQEARQRQAEREVAECKSRNDALENDLDFLANHLVSDWTNLTDVGGKAMARMRAALDEMNARGDEIAQLKTRALRAELDFRNACDRGRHIEAERDRYRDRKRELDQQEASLRDDITELSRKLEAAEREVARLKAELDYDPWPDQPPPAKPLTRDDNCPPGGHAAGVYASDTGDTLAFPGSLFLTVRACVDCGALINGGPTRCLTCADKPLTPDDVRSIARAVVAEVAERACELTRRGDGPLEKLVEAAKEESSDR